MLVDVVRAHDSKIAAQWELPVPHMEIAGRFPKSRADVLLRRTVARAPPPAPPGLREVPA